MFRRKGQKPVYTRAQTLHYKAEYPRYTKALNLNPIPAGENIWHLNSGRSPVGYWKVSRQPGSKAEKILVEVNFTAPQVMPPRPNTGNEPPISDYPYGTSNPCRPWTVRAEITFATPTNYSFYVKERPDLTEFPDNFDWQECYEFGIKAPGVAYAFVNMNPPATNYYWYDYSPGEIRLQTALHHYIAPCPRSSGTLNYSITELVGSSQPGGYVCTCPDFTKQQGALKSPYPSEQKARNWTDSNAGAEGDCKHIKAVKLLLGEPLDQGTYLPPLRPQIIRFEFGPDSVADQRFRKRLVAQNRRDAEFNRRRADQQRAYQIERDRRRRLAPLSRLPFASSTLRPDYRLPARRSLISGPYDKRAATLRFIKRVRTAFTTGGED